MDLKRLCGRERKRLRCAAFDAAAQCPNWNAFLERIMPSADARSYLQRVAGYCLTGLTCEEVVFAIYGDGSNGKSTWRETLFALLGDYAIGSW
jgi:putative DNA primase/helicase